MNAIWARVAIRDTMSVVFGLLALSCGSSMASTPDIAGGRWSTCALSGAGGVSCWGENARGQLGNGTLQSSVTPVPATGLGAGVDKLSVGNEHACVVTSAGGVKCWGRGNNGRLGNGTTTDRTTPTDVTGLTSGAMAVSAGQSHSCALTTGGGVQCFGLNSSGQLGNGSFTQSNIPVNVSGLSSGVVAVSAGGDQSCAILTGGAVKCWGANAFGQLGDGTTTNSNVPVAVSGLSSGFTDVVAKNQFTCALSAAGGLKCWGLNVFANLGNGTQTDQSTPVDVTGLTSGVVAIARGLGTSCALVTGGVVKCWGSNISGGLGDLTLVGSLVPISITTMGGAVTTVGGGVLHVCALRTWGDTKCWGDNNAGQLGNGKTAASRYPVPVAGYASGVAMVTRGAIEVRCLLTVGGGVKCMGTSNDGGELGNGTISLMTTYVPTDVVGLTSGVVAITTGNEHGCALLTAGTVKCWGWNDYGTLGDGTYVSSASPVDVVGLSGVTAISGGAYFTCAILTGGAVKCWGMNTNGQLGDGSNTTSPSPVDVSGLGSGVTALGSGDFHACAIVGGAAKCWGSGSFGVLGNGAALDSNVPVAVTGLASNVTAISAGTDHSCAVVNGGAVCWGSGAQGQLGNGAIVNSSVPVNVTGLSTGVTAIVAGTQNTCAFTSLGPQCWGTNQFGRLGIADTVASTNVPQPMVGVSGTAASIAMGGTSSCLVTTTGSLQCWGSSQYGETGQHPGSSVPVVVVKDTVLWRNTSGVDVSWVFNTPAANGFNSTVLPGVDGTWSALATCGIVAKGASDVIWFHPADGQVAIWLMNGPDAISSVSFPGAVGAGSSWQIQDCGDLDGDGIADVLWRNGITGEVLVWYFLTNGTIGQAFSIGVVPLNYVIRTLADVNGDGIKDIVFFDQAAGQVVVYQMNANGSFVAQFPGNVGPASAWNIYKAADFDGDGKDDLLWRHADGSTAVWYINGAIVETGQFLYNAPAAAWDVAAAGNYADVAAKALLWYSVATGQVVRWNMQGRTTLPLVDAVLGIGGGWSGVQ